MRNPPQPIKQDPAIAAPKQGPGRAARQKKRPAAAGGRHHFLLSKDPNGLSPRSGPARLPHLPSRPVLHQHPPSVPPASRRKERREACHNPALLPRGKLKPPRGCGNFTLAYYLLARKPMTEPALVNKLHQLYIVCGIAAVLLAFLP